MNQKGLQDMLKNKFKIGADAAASAGPVGRNAQAGTDWKLNAEFLTYSRSKGLFAGLDLDGTVLDQNKDDMAAEYGSPIPFETVLHGGDPGSCQCAPFRQHRGPLLRRPPRPALVLTHTTRCFNYTGTALSRPCSSSQVSDSDAASQATL